jgi:uncharacterized protein
MVPFIPSMRFDFSATVWFKEDDPQRVALREFEQTFGSDESVVLLIEFHEHEVFDPPAIAFIEALTERLWEVPFVQRVESLTNFQWSYAQGDELISGPFFPDDRERDEAFYRDRLNRALDHPVLPGVYFSKNLKSAMLYGRLAFDPYGESRDHRIGDVMRSLVKEVSTPEWTVHPLGQPFLSSEFQRKSFLDLYILTPILLLLVVGYLFFTFRSFMGVLIPFSVILGAVGFTTGLTGLLQFKVNSLTFILPSIVIAISIADSIHLLATFFDHFSRTRNIETAAKRSLEKNLWPIFLTSVSTSIGFFSLSFSTMVPVRDLGILAAFGTLSAMVLSYFWVIPLLMVFVSQSVRKNRPMSQRMLPREWINAYLDWLERRKRWVIAGFTVMTLIGGWLGLQSEIDSNPYKYFKARDPISIANDFTLQNFGGVAGPELVIDSGRVSGARDPSFLVQVDEYQQWISKRSEVNRVLSLIDILKEVNQALFEGEPTEYRIHPDPSVIAQEIFIYTMGLPHGMDINNRIDLEERRLRLSVLWSLQDSTPSLLAIDELLAEAQARNLNVSVTGKPILFQHMNAHVVYTFFTSMALAITLISILLLIVFRSGKAGLLSLIPNCVPVMLGAGLLKVLDKPIDIGCAIVASVTLGIAVDDTIHFLSHYYRLKKEGVSTRHALEEVFSSTGLALLITTFILATCFGLFVFAGLMPNVNFGILCAFVLTMALICDLLVLPAILLMNPLNRSSES